MITSNSLTDSVHFGAIFNMRCVVGLQYLSQLRYNVLKHTVDPIYALCLRHGDLIHQQAGYTLSSPVFCKRYDPQHFLSCAIFMSNDTLYCSKNLLVTAIIIFLLVISGAYSNIASFRIV